MLKQWVSEWSRSAQPEPGVLATALEPGCAALVTPLADFFVHQHGSVPRIDASRYRLTVSGEVREPLQLSVAELQTHFPKHTILTTLKCHGHHTNEFATASSVAPNAPCHSSGHTKAVGTAIWGGVSLTSLLQMAGVLPLAQHVVSSGLDVVEVKTQPAHYACSIPLATAWRPEVLLAYEMNGQPLTLEHGAPLRLIVPGETGARSVKWLREIKLLPFPSTSYFQGRPTADDWKPPRPLVTSPATSTEPAER